MSAKRASSLRLARETRVALRKFRAFVEGRVGQRVTTDTTLRLLLILAREAKKEGLLDRVLMRVFRVEVVPA